MTALNLEIISPTGIIFKGTCHMAVVPSVEGEMGVMFGHEAVVAALGQGQIGIYDDRQNLIKTFDVTSGFAEVGENKLLVLLDS